MDNRPSFQVRSLDTAERNLGAPSRFSPDFTAFHPGYKPTRRRTPRVVKQLAGRKQGGSAMQLFGVFFRFCDGRQVAPFVIGLLLALGVSFLVPVSVNARAIFDRTDPAFNGSVTIPLPPPGFSGSSGTSFQFQSNGVTFLFQCPSGCPLIRGGIGSGGSQGLLVTINPPVPAIGFLGEEVDGSPGGTFVGTQGNEQVFLLGSGFFGAADIGDITSANLSRQGHFFVITEMTFVPPTGVPPGDADLDILKTVSNSVAGNNQLLQSILMLKISVPMLHKMSRLSIFSIRL